MPYLTIRTRILYPVHFPHNKYSHESGNNANDPSVEIYMCACFSTSAHIGWHICSHMCWSVCKAGGGVIKTVVVLNYSFHYMRLVEMQL